ncbi:hypothetical protein FRC07_006784 [Ceratobasidium sp. 392]|nr:hypothetical protein FRC07_006784 [Ceratobasidium sp. 392]
MSRLHFYAPFIKEFWVDSSRPTSLEVDDWDPLLAYSETTELLPNLVELVCLRSGLEALSVFLSGSTQIIDLTSLDILSTSDILADVASGCPTVRELKFFVASSFDNSLTVEDLPLQTFASLSEFHNLRSLSSSTAILQPHALELLAQLPKLADLRIEAGYFHFDCSILLRHRLPAGSFPSLVTLHVDFETPQDVKNFWDFIPLNALTEVRIYMESTGDGDQSQFFPSLCRGSPLIRALSIDFPRQDNENGQVHGITADMFEYLGRLPLDLFFSTTFAKFDFDNAWEKVAISWPRVQEIRCIHQKAHLKDLMMLSASLPNLFRIECDFDLTHMASTIEHNWEPVGYLPIYTRLKQLFIKPPKLKELASSDSPHDLNDSARAFAYFWPNARISISIQAEDEAETLPDDCDYIYEDGLFNMFTKLIAAYVRSFHNV